MLLHSELAKAREPVQQPSLAVPEGDSLKAELGDCLVTAVAEMKPHPQFGKKIGKDVLALAWTLLYKFNQCPVFFKGFDQLFLKTSVDRWQAGEV